MNSQSAAHADVADSADTSRLLTVLDDAVPPDYFQFARSQTYQTIQTGDEVWRGIALLTDTTLLERIRTVLPGADQRLTFFRRSPAGQPEPNFVHSDEGMGEWTAILFLNPDPPAEDGTTFWRFRPTGAIAGSARELDKDPALWEPWRTVPARLNRLLLFDSLYFHSRAIEANYGAGDDARLVQVAFGTYSVVQSSTLTTTIREATLADLPRLVEMGQRFRAESSYAERLPENPAQMEALGRRLIADGNGLVLVAEKAGALIGMIGLFLFSHHFSGALTAGEVIFWVEPEHRGYGVRLLRRAEAWARARGATTAQLIAPSREVGQLYERLGYRLLELAYQKELSK